MYHLSGAILYIEELKRFNIDLVRRHTIGTGDRRDNSQSYGTIGCIN